MLGGGGEGEEKGAAREGIRTLTSRDENLCFMLGDVLSWCHEGAQAVLWICSYSACRSSRSLDCSTMIHRGELLDRSRARILVHHQNVGQHHVMAGQVHHRRL